VSLYTKESPDGRRSWASISGPNTAWIESDWASDGWVKATGLQRWRWELLGNKRWSLGDLAIILVIASLVRAVTGL